MTEVRSQKPEIRKHGSRINHQRQGTGRSFCDVCRSVLKLFSDLRLLISSLCALLFALCLSAEAQQPKMPKIGWLGTRSTSAGGQEAIRRMLRELGYVEGKNITFEYRFADNKVERLPALADDLLRLKVDVLVTPGINETLVAKNATKTIPIVFFSAVDPVAA